MNCIPFLLVKIHQKELLFFVGGKQMLKQMDFILRVFLYLYHTIVFEGVHLSPRNSSFCFYVFREFKLWFTLRSCVSCINWASGPIADVYVEATLFFFFKVGELLLQFIARVSANAVSSGFCAGREGLWRPSCSWAKCVFGGPSEMAGWLSCYLSFWENTSYCWSTDCEKCMLKISWNWPLVFLFLTEIRQKTFTCFLLVHSPSFVSDSLQPHGL